MGRFGYFPGWLGWLLDAVCFGFLDRGDNVALFLSRRLLLRPEKFLAVAGVFYAFFRRLYGISGIASPSDKRFGSFLFEEERCPALMLVIEISPSGSRLGRRIIAPYHPIQCIPTQGGSSADGAWFIREGVPDFLPVFAGHLAPPCFANSNASMHVSWEAMISSPSFTWYRLDSFGEVPLMHSICGLCFFWRCFSG